MTTAERLLAAGHEGITLLTSPSYDAALVGVTEDGRAVYDYEKMVAALVEAEGLTEPEAAEWIDYNTIRALPYMGPEAPLIMYPLPE